MQPMSLPGLAAAKPRETHHLFFALWPEDDARAAMAAAANAIRQQHASAGRWIHPRRYHMTLHYLGEFAELPTTLVEHACAAGDRVRVGAFDLTLDIAASFGANASVPWWLGARSVPQQLGHLWASVGDALRSDAAWPARTSALAPHVTILRQATHALETIPIAPIAWPVGDFVLIDSLLGADSRYTILRRWPLSR